MSIFGIILTIHIVSGTLGLLSGTVGLFDHHGPKRNKILAAIFMRSMIFCGFSALALSILHPNNFLFTVGIFTLYMIGTGERAFQKSQTTNSKQTVAEAYIASLTAFLVVNNYGYVPTIVVWLGPTVLITPLIFGWINNLTTHKEST